MKRILALLLALFLLLSLTACGGNEEISTAGGSTKAVEIEKEPDYNFLKADMVGIWKELYPDDTYTGYYYFASNGYVYYLADKGTPSKSTFTSEYRISTSYDIDSYDKTGGKIKGTFYCVPSSGTFDFTVEQEIMVISKDGSTRGTGRGTFVKTSITVNGNTSAGTESAGKKYTCEVCGKEGTNKYDSFTGQTEYYCTQHYKELLEMLEALSTN